jgi:hypothetical protein
MGGISYNVWLRDLCAGLWWFEWNGKNQWTVLIISTTFSDMFLLEVCVVTCIQTSNTVCSEIRCEHIKTRSSIERTILSKN